MPTPPSQATQHESDLAQAAELPLLDQRVFGNQGEEDRDLVGPPRPLQRGGRASEARLVL